MGYWVWRRWGRENEKKKYVYKKSSKKEQNCFMLMDWPIILPCRSLTDALYTVLSIWCTGILYSQIFQWIIHIFFQRNPLFYDHWHWQYCCPYQIQSLSQMHSLFQSEELVLLIFILAVTPANQTSLILDLFVGKKQNL